MAINLEEYNLINCTSSVRLKEVLSWMGLFLFLVLSYSPYLWYLFLKCNQTLKDSVCILWLSSKFQRVFVLFFLNFSFEHSSVIPLYGQQFQEWILYLVTDTVTLASPFLPWLGDRPISRSWGSYKSSSSEGVPNSLCTCSCNVSTSHEPIS